MKEQGGRKREKRVSPTEATPLFVNVASWERAEEQARSNRKWLRWCFPSSHMFQLIAGTLALTVIALVLNHSSTDSTRSPNDQTTHVSYNHQQQNPHSPTGSGKTSTPSSSSQTVSSKYNQVQGIGFQIYTGGAPAFVNNTPNPECAYQNAYGQVITETTPQLQCYLGDIDPLMDVAKRVRIMKTAVEAALHAANDDPTILKVFIAPEFYWRGLDGAYAFADEKIRNDLVCGPICNILRELQDFVADPRFAHWLFLFGTVVAYDVLPQQDEYDYLFYNFAPVYKGYDPDTTTAEGKRFLLPKRYVSSSDFLTPRRHLNATLFKELVGDTALQQGHADSTVRNPFDFAQKRYSDQLWKDYKMEVAELGYTMIEYDWLMVDNLSISLEICFDHQMRTALTTYLGDMVTGRHTFIPSSSDDSLSTAHIPASQAQISIVSSAGMTITPDALALVHNGVIFLQDGLSHAPQHTIADNGRSTNNDAAPEFTGGTEGLQRRVILTHTDVSFAYAWLPQARAVDLVPNNDDDDILENVFSRTQYNPQINVFGPVEIAKVKQQEANNESL